MDTLDTFKYMDSEGLTDSLFKKKLAYPYEKFNLENISIDSLSQPLNLTKAGYYPCDDDIKKLNN